MLEVQLSAGLVSLVRQGRSLGSQAMAERCDEEAALALCTCRSLPWALAEITETVRLEVPGAERGKFLAKLSF